MSASDWRGVFSAADREKVQQALLATLQQLPASNRDPTRLRTVAETFEGEQFAKAGSRQEYIDSVRKKILHLQAAARNVRLQQQQQRQQLQALPASQLLQQSRPAHSVGGLHIAQNAAQSLRTAVSTSMANNSQQLQLPTGQSMQSITKLPPAQPLQHLQAQQSLHMNPQNPSKEEIPLILEKTRELMEHIQVTDKITQNLQPYSEQFPPVYHQLLLHWTKMKDIYIKHCTALTKGVFLLGISELEKLSDQTAIMRKRLEQMFNGIQQQALNHQTVQPQQSLNTTATVTPPIQSTKVQPSTPTASVIASSSTSNKIATPVVSASSFTVVQQQSVSTPRNTPQTSNITVKPIKTSESITSDNVQSTNNHSATVSTSPPFTQRLRIEVPKGTKQTVAPPRSQLTSQEWSKQQNPRKTFQGSVPSPQSVPTSTVTPPSTLPLQPPALSLTPAKPSAQPTASLTVKTLGNASSTRKQPPIKQSFKRQSAYLSAQIKFLTDTKHPDTWISQVADSAFGSLFARHTGHDLAAWNIFPKRPRQVEDDELLEDILFERDIKRVKAREIQEAELLHDLFAQL